MDRRCSGEPQRSLGFRSAKPWDPARPRARSVRSLPGADHAHEPDRRVRSVDHDQLEVRNVFLGLYLRLTYCFFRPRRVVLAAALPRSEVPGSLTPLGESGMPSPRSSSRGGTKTAVRPYASPSPPGGRPAGGGAPTLCSFLRTPIP